MDSVPAASTGLDTHLAFDAWLVNWQLTVHALEVPCVHMAFRSHAGQHPAPSNSVFLILCGPIVSVMVLIRRCALTGMRALEIMLAKALDIARHAP